MTTGSVPPPVGGADFRGPHFGAPMRPPHHPWMHPWDMHSTGGFRGHAPFRHHHHNRMHHGHHEDMMAMMMKGPMGMPPPPMHNGGRMIHQDGKPILTYFDIPGLAESIRMVFLVGGVAFEDRRVSREEWTARYKSYSPTKQCPILEVDGHVIVQSQAILQYAASRSHLLPRGEEQMMAAMMIVGKLHDLKCKVEPTSKMPAGEQKDQAVKETMETIILPYLNDLEKLVASNQAEMQTHPVGPVPTGEHAMGEQMTYVDVVIADYLNQAHTRGYPIDLAMYPKLSTIKNAVFSHPAVAAYMITRKATKPRLYSSQLAGKAHPIRFAFAIGNIEFEDVHISREELKAMKGETLTLTMPYLEVDGKTYTESTGILAYAASRAGLMPCGHIDRAYGWSVVRSIEQVYDSWTAQKVKLEGHADMEKMLREWVSQDCMSIIERVESLVSEYQDAEGHVVGRKLSFADLAVAGLYMNIHSHWAGPFFDHNSTQQFARLKRTYDMVMNISAVKKFEYEFSKAKPVLVHMDENVAAIKAMMAFAKIDYEDRRVENKEVFETTHKTVSPTGKLPYMEIDGQVVAGTKAIITYLAERAELMPPTYLGRARAEMVFQTWEPVKAYLAENLYTLPHGPDRQRIQMEIRDNKMHNMLAAYEHVLAPKQHTLGYLVDNQLTYIDMYVAHQFEQLRKDGLLNDESNYPVLSKVTAAVMNKCAH